MIVVSESTPDDCAVCEGRRVVVMRRLRDGERVVMTCPHCTPAPGAPPVRYVIGDPAA